MTETGGVIIRVIFLNSSSLNLSARFQTVLRLICCLFSTSSWKTQWNSLWSKNNSFLLIERRNEKKKKIGGAEGLRNYGRSAVFTRNKYALPWTLIVFLFTMFVLWMYNEALNAGFNSRETVSFVFPRVPMFPLTSSRKYWDPWQKKTNCFPQKQTWENNNRLIMADCFWRVIVISIGTFEKGLSKFLVLISKTWN